MKVLAFLNLHHQPGLGALTKNRNSATVSFLGRYAFMDFMLSNFSNSGIDRVAVLVDQHPQSVLKHLGSRNIFNLNTKIGFNMVAYNESASRYGPRYNTDIANIIFHKYLLKEHDPDVIVVAPSYFLMPLDLRQVIKEHKDNHADITVVYQDVNNAKTQFIGRGVITVDEEGHVKTFTRNKGEEDKRSVSTEVFVISRRVFEELLAEAQSTSPFYTLSDVIAQRIIDGHTVNSYHYKGYLRSIDSYANYFRFSFELLTYTIRKELFLDDWPIYTVTHDTQPAKYGQTANVKNSFVANGAKIEGTVKNAIISRNVVVEKGAVIENAIVFTDTTIRADQKLKYVLLDKEVEVRLINELSGTEDDILYIKKGDKI
ncbi:MAG TPA: glucose-1-phosphate adenylyltransferase subunit GlgD [Bacilli bacterium]|nr:glucose-1-phosphate adenylyltransferase subunit GlgD [Bacilli bacterium]